MAEQVPNERLVAFTNPEIRNHEGVVLKSWGWSGGSGSTDLECGSCSTRFLWKSNPEHRWLPDLNLKFCPGCGKPIEGCLVPKDPPHVPRPAVMR